MAPDPAVPSARSPAAEIYNTAYLPQCAWVAPTLGLLALRQVRVRFGESFDGGKGRGLGPRRMDHLLSVTKQLSER